MTIKDTSSECRRLSEKQRSELALSQGPLDRARSLPPWTYTDADFFALEEKYVLRREWLSVGRIDDIPEPGDFFTTSVLREPLIIVRGEDGEIRALSAVCTHRGRVITSDRGNTKRFICPYHTWNFKLNGDLAAAPMMEGNTAFKKSDCGLPKLRTEIWQGWIFINFDPDAEPLAPRLKSLDEILAPYRLSELKTPISPLVYEQNFNWKLLSPDNWEHYHVLGVHAESLLSTGIFTARTDFPWKDGDAYSITLNPIKEGTEFPITMKEISGLSPDQRRGTLAIHVFPCHIFLVSPQHMLYYKVLPDRADHFQLEANLSVLAEVAEDPTFAETFADYRTRLDYIHEKEDMPTLEGTQAGIRSSLYKQGFLSSEERPLWHFYNYLIPKVLEGVDRDQ